MDAFKAAKKKPENGTLENRQAIIEQYVDQIVVYRDHIDVRFNIIKDFGVNKNCPR